MLLRNLLITSVGGLEIDDQTIEWDARNTRKCICFFFLPHRKKGYERNTNKQIKNPMDQ